MWFPAHICQPTASVTIAPGDSTPDLCCTAHTHTHTLCTQTNKVCAQVKYICERMHKVSGTGIAAKETLVYLQGPLSSCLPHKTVIPVYFRILHTCWNLFFRHSVILHLFSKSHFGASINSSCILFVYGNWQVFSLPAPSYSWSESNHKVNPQLTENPYLGPRS